MEGLELGLQLKPDENRIKILNYIANKVLHSSLLLEEDEFYLNLLWPVREITEEKSKLPLLGYCCILSGTIIACYTKKLRFLSLLSIPACFYGGHHVYTSYNFYSVKLSVGKLVESLKEQVILNKKILYYLRQRSQAFSQLGEFLKDSKLYAAVRHNEKEFGMGFILNTSIICKELCRILEYWKNVMDINSYNNILQYSQNLQIPDKDFKVEEVFIMFSDITNLFLLSSSGALTLLVIGLCGAVAPQNNNFDFILHNLLPIVVKRIAAKVSEIKTQYLHISNKMIFLDEVTPSTVNINNPHYTIITQYMERIQIAFDIALALKQNFSKEVEFNKDSIISSLTEMLIYHNSAKTDIDMLLKIYTNKAQELPLPPDMQVNETVDLNDPSNEPEKEEFFYDMADFNADVKTAKKKFAKNYDLLAEKISQKALIMELQSKLDLINIEKGRSYIVDIPISPLEKPGVENIPAIRSGEIPPLPPPMFQMGETSFTPLEMQYTSMEAIVNIAKTFKSKEDTFGDDQDIIDNFNNC